MVSQSVNFVLILILTCIKQSSQFELNQTRNTFHPRKDENYFQNELAPNGEYNTITEELQCNVALSGTTTKNDLVHYYHINLTRETMELYSAFLTVTTCCFIVDNTQIQMYQPTFEEALEEYYNLTNITDADIDDIETEMWINEYNVWRTYCNNSIPFQEIAYFYDGYACGHSSTCNDSSLDTILYILSEKNGIITLLDHSDDTSSSICRNTKKSLIDLKQFIENTYIIAVGGFGAQVGTYQINFECTQFSRPIQNTEINPSISDTLTCGMQLNNQQNSIHHLVSYYNFSITDNMHYPIVITTCEVSDETDFYNILYLVQEVNAGIQQEYKILHTSNYSQRCHSDVPADIIIESPFQYGTGEFIIMVQNYWVNDVNEFSITMHCTSHETIEVKWAIGLTASLGSFLIICLVCYCIIFIRFRKKQSVKFDKFLNDHALSEFAAKLKKHISIMQEIKHFEDKELEYIAILCELDSKSQGVFIDACHEYQSGEWPKKEEYVKMATTNLLFNTSAGSNSFQYEKVKRQVSEDEEVLDEVDLHTTAQQHIEMQPLPLKPTNVLPQPDLSVTMPALQPAQKIRLQSSGIIQTPKLHGSQGSVRRIAMNETRTNLKLEPHEDTILRAVAHVEAFCQENEGLDIYQVLAVRTMDHHSSAPSLWYPFKQYECCSSCKVRCCRMRYCYLMHISAFHRSLASALIVGCLQTFGITGTVVGLMHFHFSDVDGIDCPLEKEHWVDGWIILYKTMAFLWSLYISFSIGSKMVSIKHNGLYKLFSVLDYEDLEKITCVDFTIVQWGQLINYWAACFAVFGSFFIIFETKNADTNPAVEMILNALALFFMLEADNTIVYFQDYDEIPKIWNKFGEKYEQCLQNSHSLKQNNSERKQKTHRCPKCYRCCERLCQHQQIPHIFAVTVTGLMYLVGAVAPFFIFFCW